MRIKNGKIEIPKFLSLETYLTTFTIRVTLQIDSFAYNYFKERNVKPEIQVFKVGKRHYVSAVKSFNICEKSIDEAIGLDAYRMLDYLKINIRYIKIKQLEQEIKDIKAYWL